MNAWLPVARDALLDRLCAAPTHTDAGLEGGVTDVVLDELTGQYVGGGNIIRSLRVSRSNEKKPHVNLRQ